MPVASRQRPSQTMPATPFGPGRFDDVLAEGAGGGESVGGDHEHIARLRHVDRFPDHQVVAGPRPHRQRGTAEPRGGIERLDPVVHRAQPVHRVADVAGRRVAEGRDQLRRRARRVEDDAESDGGRACHLVSSFRRSDRPAPPRRRRVACWRNRHPFWCAARRPSRRRCAA